MHFYFRRSYRGPLALAIFDWAGTTVDFGCMAPAAVFVEGFRRQSVDITMAEARAPMGMEKRAHIAAIGAMPAVAERWQQAHDRAMNDKDIDAMYQAFVPLLLDVLDGHAIIIPGMLETAAALRERSIRIAGTTGYFDAAMDVVLAAAARQGYAPDCSICATQVSAGRPAPWMIYRVMEALAVYPPEAVVKIGDTVPDIEAGLNAGVWTVGVTQSGNAVGLSQADFAALSPDEQNVRTTAARQMLEHAGAHFVIDGVWNLPPLIDHINAMLRAGERP